MKVIVYHATYGCDTGCCGHVVAFIDNGGNEYKRQFEFEHPYGEDKKEFAKRLVTETFGEEHVADLDWENSFITED